jgi:hypothetical protein
MKLTDILALICDATPEQLEALTARAAAIANPEAGDIAMWACDYRREELRMVAAVRRQLA